MSFVGRFFLLVLLLGFGELYLLVKVAALAGFATTLALCVLTGVVGGGLVRAQGLRTLLQIQTQLDRGEMPAREIVSGLVLLAVGLMLLTPGFITDTIGFLFLIPALRLAAAERVARLMEGRVAMQRAPLGFGGYGPRPGGAEPPRPPAGKVIDVEPE